MSSISATGLLQKTSEVTRTLRSRDYPLLALIGTAQQLISSPNYSDLSFPRRNEWLLEWIMQRLKEEEGTAGREARASAETWRLLLSLLQRVLPADIARTIKQHGIVDTVARLMSQLRKTEDQQNSPPPQESLASNNSLPHTGNDISGEQIANLLDSTADVLIYLDQISKTSSFTSISKTTVETSATILGDFFVVSEILLSKGIALQDKWLTSVDRLWRNSIWGYSNPEKISVVWADKCLRPAIMLILSPNVPFHFIDTAEGMISTHIFSTEIMLQYNNAQNFAALPSPINLQPLLMPLKAQGFRTLENRPCEFILPLFKIAIKSISAWQNNKPDPRLVEMLFKTLIYAVDGLDLTSDIPIHASNNIAALLRVVFDTGCSLPLITLTQIISRTANLSSMDIANIQWPIIEQVLKNDFDVFVHPSNSKLASELFSAISRSNPHHNAPAEMSRILFLLVEGFANARDLLRFVRHWKHGLGNNKKTWWRNSILKEAFSEQIEKSFTPSQIETLVKELVEERYWEILDATLRGVNKKETEDMLAHGSYFRDIVSKVTEKMEQDSCTAWRVLVRIGEIRPAILHLAIDVAEKFLQDMSCLQLTVFAAQVILQVTEASGNYEGASSVFNKVSEAWVALNKHHVDGIFYDNSNLLRFAGTVSASIVARYLGLMEMIDSDTRNIFVDSLLSAACKFSPALNIWNDMVQSSEFLECTSLKQAVLSALISSLEPYSSLAEHMKSALEQERLESISPERRTLFSFILSGIQKYPIQAIKRPTRERILDICLLLEADGYSLSRPLVDKLWMVGNASAYIASDANAFIIYCQTQNTNTAARRILSHACMNKEQNKVRKYLVDVLNLISSFDNAGVWDQRQVKISATIITELWDIREDSKINRDSIIENTRRKFLELLEYSLNTMGYLDKSFLQAWRIVWVLKRDSRLKALELASIIAGHFASNKINGDDTAIEGLGIIFLVAETVEDMIKAIALSIFVHQKSENQPNTIIIESYRSMIDRLDVQAQICILKRLTEGCTSTELAESSWIYLRILIDNLKKPQYLDRIFDVTVPFYTTLLSSVQSSHSLATFLSSTTTINTVLRDKFWIITQYCIDSTLATLAVAISPCGPQIGRVDPNEVYISVVQILTSILTLHRHRIRGRYHMVVAFLQQLMTCLFTPRILHETIYQTTHPPWLQLNANSPINIHSARAFSRALQVFCDPPVSAVRNHKSELADSKRVKERKMVSIAVGPVLEWYVKRVLEDAVDIEVRQELSIGIERVLGVLGREGVGRASERMTTEGRTIVRSLWSDYGRNIRERV